MDRAHAYKNFAKSVPGVILSFCWAHFRRDFVRAAVGNALLRKWAKRWIGRVFPLDRLNRERLKALGDPEAFTKVQAAKLEAAVKKMFENISAELSDPNLSPAQRQVLEVCGQALRRSHRICPRSPGAHGQQSAERLLRIVALARNNFYGMLNGANSAGPFA